MFHQYNQAWWLAGNRILQNYTDQLYLYSDIGSSKKLKILDRHLAKAHFSNIHHFRFSSFKKISRSLDEYLSPKLFELPLVSRKAFIESVIEQIIIIYGVQGQWKSLETILDDLIKFFSGVGVSLDKSIVIKSDSMLSSSRPKNQISSLPSKLNRQGHFRRIRVTTGNHCRGRKQGGSYQDSIFL